MNWRKIAQGLVLAISLAVVAFSVPAARRYVYLDRCLDSGGRVAADGSCEGAGQAGGERP